MIKNYFMAAMAVMNLGAAAQYYWAGSPKLAAMVACYAVSSAILSTVE